MKEERKEGNITIISPFCTSCKKEVSKDNLFVQITDNEKTNGLCVCSDEQLKSASFVNINKFFCGDCATPVEVKFEYINKQSFCCPEEEPPKPNVVCQGEFVEIDTWGDILEFAEKPAKLKFPCDIKLNVPKEYLEKIYTDYRPDIIICWADGFHYACPDSRRFEYEDYSSLQDPLYDEKPYSHEYGSSPW